MLFNHDNPVPDPDLKIRGGGGVVGGHPDPYIRVGGVQSPKKFSTLRASVWSKNKGACIRHCNRWLSHSLKLSRTLKQDFQIKSLLYTLFVFKFVKKTVSYNIVCVFYFVHLFSKIKMRKLPSSKLSRRGLNLHSFVKVLFSLCNILYREIKDIQKFRLF